MKKLTLILFAIFAFISCNKNKKEVEKETVEIASITPQTMESAVIYEANVRQYSKEGSFNAFTKDIPEIKKLGVKVIWLMPIFPISETKRKATGGDFAYLIEDEAERKKMLGSYYAVTDYTKVNPEFGTIEDFRTLLKTAHDNGIYVILDWVPNHTGWDHVWIKQHPEYYTQNAKGEIIDPINPDNGESWGWADVADLNYNNQDMRKEMIEDMLHWVKNEGVDGFRCDVASAVPLDFWEQAIPKLRAEKDIFMLAEAEEPKLLKGTNLFDMAYAWGMHHELNEIAQGKKDASVWYHKMKEMNERFEADDFFMNFITNHDENSWNGTVEERMGEATEALLALTYVAPGMPLIYSGQEYDLNHRLKFFEKDEIPKVKGKMWPILEKLGKLKNTSSALHGGKDAASYQKIDIENANVIAFKRSKNGSTILFLANASNKELKTSLPQKGKYIDYISNTAFELQGDVISLAPWEYKILIE